MIDFKEFLIEKGFERSILMTSSFRSGSSVIGDLIGKNGFPGLTDEKFADAWTRKLDSETAMLEFFESIISNVERPIYKSKIMWPQRNNFSRAINLDSSNSKEFSALFPNPTWIHVYRNDVFSQAVSFWKAKKTNLWHVYNKSALKTGNVEYVFNELLIALREIFLHDKLWREFYIYAEISPIYVCYEDFLKSPLDVITNVLSGLSEDSFDVVESMPSLIRQSDEHSQEVRKRFMDDLFQMGH